MPTLTLSDDVAVHFEDSGGPGPAIIVGHGFLMDHRTFDAQAERLPQYRWIRWDLRGHGQSTTSETEYSFWDQARDGLALLDHLDVDRAVFAGHSQGAFVALRMALLEPDRCRGLLILGAANEPYSDTMREGYRNLFRSWEPGTAEGDLITAAMAPAMIGGENDLQRLWRDRWNEAHTDRDRFLAALNCLVEVDDIADLSPSITAPTLFIRGAADQAFSADAVQRSADELPGAAPVVTIDGHTHGVHMTAPDTVNRVIDDWLSQLDD